MGSCAHHAGIPFVQQSQGAIDDLRSLRSQVTLLVRIFYDIEEHTVRKGMIAVMVGSDAQIVIEPDRSLAAPGALGDDQIVPPGLFPIAKCLGEAAAVPDRRHSAS